MTKEERAEYWERDYQAAIKPLMELIKQERDERRNEYQELREEVKKMSANTNEMYEWFANMSFTGKLLMRFLQIATVIVVSLGTIIGAILAVKHWLNN